MWVLCLLVGGRSECLVIWVFFFASCGLVVVVVVVVGVGVGVVFAHGWSIGVLGDLGFFFFRLLWTASVGGGCGCD